MELRCDWTPCEWRGGDSTSSPPVTGERRSQLELRKQISLGDCHTGTLLETVQNVSAAAGYWCVLSLLITLASRGTSKHFQPKPILGRLSYM